MGNALKNRDVPAPVAGWPHRKATLMLALLSLSILSGCGDAATAPSPEARLVEAGWSFGFCLGACNGALALDAARVSYEVTSRAGDEVLAQSRGALTASGTARLSALLAALPAELLDRYGCPDCGDAGAAYVVLDRDASARRSEYEYPNPPPELAALDTFLKQVMDALGRCRSIAEVQVDAGCIPVP